MLKTVVDGCRNMQWIWHLSWNEDIELFVNETVSLERNVEYTVIQVDNSAVIHSRAAFY